MDICIDRYCTVQHNGPHYTNNSLIITDIRIIEELERAKAERGGKCWSCNRYLIYTDKDHSFCEDCWAQMMKHTFISSASPLFAALEDDKCTECGEVYDTPVHATNIDLWN